MFTEKIPEYNSFEFTINEAHEDLLERKLISRNLGSGEIAVDLGGGYGRLTNVLLDHYKFVILIDYSVRNLERASKTLDKERVVFVLADARNPPILDGSVDFILSIRVMHHYSDLAFLTSVTNKLRKGGSFLFNLNNVSSPLFIVHMVKNIRTPAKDGINVFRRGTQRISDEDGSRPIYFLSYGDIRRTVPRGCRLERIIGTGIFHNSIIERNVKFMDLDRLTNAELSLSNFIRNAWLFPDVFLLLTNKREIENREFNNPIEVVRCIRCGGALRKNKDSIECVQCDKQYVYKNEILDMRSNSVGAVFSD